MMGRLTIVVLCALTSGVAAQTSNWTDVTAVTPPARNHAMAQDLGGAHTLLFGDGETWRWTGAWSQLQHATAPASRTEHAMAAASTQGGVLLFGGQSALARSDTWIHNFGVWTQASPATVPPARHSHVLALDTARNVVVMFGGFDDYGAAFSDTWEWDGFDWALQSPAQSPVGGGRLHMTFDQARGVCVLLETGTSGGYRSDTWEWDGLDWTLRLSSLAPSGPFRGEAAYDVARQRTVVVGWSYATGARTWEWDGVDWSFTPVGGARGTLEGHAVVYDTARQAVLLWGGSQVFGAPGGLPSLEVWRWSGAGWSASSPKQYLDARNVEAMVDDRARGEVVMFGGASGAETWVWDGSNWTNRVPSSAPPARTGHGMAFDSLRQRVVLFGGQQGSLPLADTWEWDGTTWTQAVPLTTPPARRGHEMVFDDARGVVVMTQGADAAGQRNDTWEYDGTDWVLRQPAVSPPGLEKTAMVYDAAEDRTVLFGQIPAISMFQIWHWDGLSWENQAQNRYNAGRVAAFDSLRGIVMLGETDPFVSPGNFFAPRVWTGQSLDFLPAATQIGNLGDLLEFTYDSTRDRYLIHSGLSPFAGVPARTFTASIDPALANAFGPRCTAPGSFPSLRMSARPIIGQAFDMTIQFVNLPGASMFGMIGFSRTVTGGAALPIDLTPFGASGCQLLISSEAIQALASPNSFGTTQWSLPIPVQPSLSGLRVFAQGAALSPGVNALGILTTNALALRLGVD